MNIEITLPRAVCEVCEEINSVAKAVVVGGFIRDALLGLESFDVDIEVYEMEELELLEAKLKKFGSIYEVGKSFGVILLLFKGYSFDITLARKENKVGIGHKGFHVTSAPYERFEVIAKRRDFTINAMGFDTKEQIFLDPFSGTADLQNGRLDLVNSKRFSEDPLRVLRGVGFISRFNLHATPLLIETSKKMVAQGMMQELSAERIYAEIQKWFLKSAKPSLGFVFLEAIAYALFSQVRQLKRSLARLDRAENSFSLRLTALYLETPWDQAVEDLQRWCGHLKLLKEIELLHRAFHVFSQMEKSSYELKKLALLLPLQKLHALLVNVNMEDASWLESEAATLGVWETMIDPLVKGQDLLDRGMKASKAFKIYLDRAYDLQLHDSKLTKEQLLSYITKSII